MGITTMYLLSMFVCSTAYANDNGMLSPKAVCTTYYDVYPTEARCEVALAIWFERGVPASHQTSECSRKDLTPDDIAIYRSARYQTAK